MGTRDKGRSVGTFFYFFIFLFFAIYLYICYSSPNPSNWIRMSSQMDVQKIFLNPLLDRQNQTQCTERQAERIERLTNRQTQPTPTLPWFPKPSRVWITTSLKMQVNLV